MKKTGNKLRQVWGVEIKILAKSGEGNHPLNSKRVGGKKRRVGESD